MLALLRRHAAVAGRGRGADRAGAAPERFLGLRRQRAEAHAGDGDRDLQRDRLLGEARADRDVGRAFLAIAFERIAADRGAEEQQIVEMRQLALGAGAADVVDAGRRGAADLGDRVVVEGRRLARRRVDPAVLRASSVRPDIVDVEMIEPARRAVAAELADIDRCRRGRPRRAAAAARALCCSSSGFSMQSAPRLFTAPRT